MVVVRGDEFVVSVKKKEMVAALLPMQEHWLPLSNLDLLLPPLDVSLLLCYKKPITISTTLTMVGILKKALAQALVSYYAFGGEVVENSVGEPELLCNNNGVEFIEAFADVELQNLDFYNPDESVEGKLVPKKKLGVLAVQVTELKCGSVIVGCTFDHRISDAHSANMFLVSWAEITQSKPISTLPSFRRSILNPRYHTGKFNRSLDEMYIPISTLPPPEEPSPSDHLLSRIYYIKSNDLIGLQSLASSNVCKRTKLESFSALLWKIVAKSATYKDTTASNKVSNMGVVVDGRTRLGHDGVHKATTMENYFGNVLSIPYGSIRVDDLNSKPLNWVADEIHGFLETLVTKDHFLDLIDWVEAHRPEPAMCKIYNSRNEDGPAFVVSSGQRFPVEKMDFGWGVPIFGSYHFPWGGRCGYVMPMPSPRRNGDWIVYMHLSKGQLELIETEFSNLFKPLTPEYLNVVTTSS